MFMMFEHTKYIDIHSNKHSASKRVFLHTVCAFTQIFTFICSYFKIKFFKCKVYVYLRVWVLLVVVILAILLLLKG